MKSAHRLATGATAGLIAGLNGRNTALPFAAQLMPLRSGLAQSLDARRRDGISAVLHSFPHAANAIDFEFNQLAFLHPPNPLLQRLVAMNIFDPQGVIADLDKTHDEYLRVCDSQLSGFDADYLLPVGCLDTFEHPRR